MSNVIRSGAIIHKSVSLNDVQVGHDSIIEEGVVVGEGTVIGNRTILKKGLVLGKNNWIGHGVILSSDPIIRGFNRSITSGVVFGDNNIIHDGVICHRSKFEKTHTQIGNNNTFYLHSHVSHDNTIGNDNIFEKDVTLLGHVQVGDGIHLSSAVGVHQFCMLGDGSMVEKESKVDQNIIPYTKLGMNKRIYLYTKEELRERGLCSEEIEGLNALFQILFKSQKTLRNAIETIDRNAIKGVSALKVYNFCVEYMDNSRGFHCLMGQ